MKKMMILTAALLLFGTVGRAALTEKDLTPAAIQKAIVATPVAKRQAMARQVIEAIAAQPADAEAKVQSLVSASRALLQGGGSIAIIAELFNTIPVEYLQSVAELLARENFDQKANSMTDEQFDTFCAKVVSGASKYIEAAGSDSPAVRISILAATFSVASSDPDRTRPKMIAVLPPAMQAAATTFVFASEQGDRETIAAAAGVDEVAETAADPDTDKVEQAVTETAAPAGAAVVAVDPAESDDAADGIITDPPALTPESDYLEPTPPAVAATPAADEAEDVPDVKVPLLSRFADDVLGIAIDTSAAALYDWDGTTLLPPTITVDAVPELIPGEMVPAGTLTPPEVEFIPSPGYGNQEIFK